MDEADAPPLPIDGRILDILDELTDSERRLAEVVLETQGNLSAFTAGELAEKAGVSNATAARFFQRLGYKSYSEARRQARLVQAWGSPLYELTGVRERVPEVGGFALHVAQDLQNLTRTAETLSPEAISRSIDLLVAARTIWTVGFRNSFALAAYARGLLMNAKPDVRLLPVAGSTIGEELAGIGPDDVFLVMGFRRRPVVLREILDVAREARAPSILITDLTAARTTQLATITLRCHNRGASQLDSYAAPISLINHICSATGLALGEAGLKRLGIIEGLHDRLDPFSSTSSARRRKK